MMWVAILIVFLILLIFFKLCWALFRPIFVFIYNSMVDALRITGISRDAAKALISIVAIILIIAIVF